MNVFLRNIDEGADSFNAVWDSWVDRENLPVGGWLVLCRVLEVVLLELQITGLLLFQVRTTIEAKLMRPNLLVEVDCIAAARQA